VSDFQTGQSWAGDPQWPSWSWRGDHERTRPGTPLGAGPVPYPVFIAQGTEDKTWGADMARRLAARMTKAGHPPETRFFDGEDHMLRAAARNREWELMVDFFSRHLGRVQPPLSGPGRMLVQHRSWGRG